MSATVPVYVKVIIGQEQWIEVSAATKQEAMDKAVQIPDVVYVVDATYGTPDAAVSEL